MSQTAGAGAPWQRIQLLACLHYYRHQLVCHDLSETRHQDSPNVVSPTSTEVARYHLVVSHHGPVQWFRLQLLGGVKRSPRQQNHASRGVEEV
jgi:hypothetical protein